MSTRKNIDKIKKAILRNTRKKRKSLKKASIETKNKFVSIRNYRTKNSNERFR